MKKRILSIALIAPLIIVGCSSTGSTNSDDGTLLEAFNAFVNILDRSQPFVKESQEWEQYSIDKTNQGVVYSNATVEDTQFISKKMNAEYAGAVDRLSRIAAVNDSITKELDEASQDYRFTYHQVMTVKAKNSAKPIGYCVNFDVNLYENGKPTSWDASGNTQKGFIYLATDKPLSISTVSPDFIKRMCGNEFFNKYKNPKS